MIGCREVGIDEPVGSKSLLVYVEIDRCATDAIQAVTGCKLGKRTLKFLDYGKVAATFLNQDTGHAVRVLARDDSRDAVAAYAPAGMDKKAAQDYAYKLMPEEALFILEPVRVDVPDADLPGHPLRRVPCDRCGEGINDGREVRQEGKTLCKPCAHGAYYQPLGTALAPREG
jgi:formylmethanofuran dehydrogenase subunit E